MKRALLGTLGAAVAVLLVNEPARADEPDAKAPAISWVVRGAGGGGAMFSPSYSFHDPNVFSIASDMSSLFHTTNGGKFFLMHNAEQIQGNKGSRVCYTTDPKVRYCIDFTNVEGDDAMRVKKTTDGGATWNLLESDPTERGSMSLYVDPRNPDRVLTSNFHDVYFSADGGKTFAMKFNTKDDNQGIHVAGVFFDGDTIYVGTSKGLYISKDAGDKFELASIGGIPAAEAIVSFCGAKQADKTRLFAVTLTAGVWAGITGSENAAFAGVYVLDVGQPKWTKRNSGLSGARPFFIDAALTDIETVYVAGGSDAGPIVYKSTNGGGKWESVFRTTGNKNIATGWQGEGGDRDWTFGEYALGFAVAPLDPKFVIITDLGGGHATTDGGKTWAALYVNPADRNKPGSAIPPGKAYHNSGLDNTGSWTLTWADEKTMFMGNSDVKGQRSTDGGKSWGFGYTGHEDNCMYWSVRHPKTGVLYAATGSIHDLYQSTHLSDEAINPATGKVLFSTDKGATWKNLHSFEDPVAWVTLDPNKPNRLYASVVNNTDGGIFVSNNINQGEKSTWTKLSKPERTEGHPYNVVVLKDGTLVATYSGRRDDKGKFTGSSGLFVSTDEGKTWTDRSDDGMHYWTFDVTVDPSDKDEKTWYVAVYSGWGGAPNGKGGLYRTTDRGENWTKINSQDRVSSVTIDPTNKDVAYLSTETEGLWYSINLHAEEPTWVRVATYPFRHPTRVFFNPHDPKDMWVTSFGGGLLQGRVAALKNDEKAKDKEE